MSWNVAPAFARAGPPKKPPGIAGPKDRQSKGCRKGAASWEGQSTEQDECGPVNRIAADDRDLAEGCKDEWADTVGWNVE